MNDGYTPIRGFRIQHERKEDRQLSVGYLHQKPEAVKAREKLVAQVTEATLANEQGNGPAVPCVSDPEGFSGDNLISERDAQLLCHSCPAFQACDVYRIVSRSPHGILAGQRKVMEIPDD